MGPSFSSGFQTYLLSPLGSPFLSSFVCIPGLPLQVPFSGELRSFQEIGAGSCYQVPALCLNLTSRDLHMSFSSEAQDQASACC